MLSNMSASLIQHETIKTTVVKAKELRRFVEPLITLSKTDSVANRRRAFSKLRDKAAVGKLFSELGPRFKERPGGYTRILKAGHRQGDAAMVAYMFLLDQPDQPRSLDEQKPEPLTTTALAPQEEETSAEEESPVEQEASATDTEEAVTAEAETATESDTESESPTTSTATDEEQTQTSEDPDKPKA